MPSPSLSRRTLPSIGFVACALAACTAASPPELRFDHPNLLVIDIDSLRADRPFAERNGHPVMPHVRALADRGVRFTSAMAQSGWTTPALASILTGHLPVPVEMGGQATAVLPVGARTFAEILSLYDYRTTILWGPAVEATLPELSNGFSGRLQHVFSPGVGDPYAEALGDDVFTEPFALMVHDFDAHGPPPALAATPDLEFGETHEACGGGPYPELSKRLTPTLGGAGTITHLLGHYDSSLHRYDTFLGKLLAAMDARGLLDRTVVVVTSNHGEDIGDRGGDLKHGGLYDVVLRVPLVVAGPGIRPAGRTVDTVVQGIDLAPTFVALADAPPDRTVAGVSLLPLLVGGEPPASLLERPAFALTNAGNVSVRLPTRKLILSDRPDWLPPDAPVQRSSGPVYEYYDLVADPEERVNLYPTRGDEAADLVRALTAFAADRRAAGSQGARQEVDADLRERYRQSGYWGIVGDEDQPGPPPDRADGADAGPGRGPGGDLNTAR